MITSNFPKLVERELQNARELHGNQHSMHESYAVILEELEEMWDEIKERDPNRTLVLKELVQVAAMCQRAAEDLKLMMA
jgi:hypothetical protein